MHEALELRRLCPRWEQALVAFFDELERSGRARFFHPHPFDAEHAHRLAHDRGLDLYYVLVEGDHILGYGMLRGWAAGYDIPSLGLILDPAVQGLGLGETFMRLLHHAAARRGAMRIRLKVYPENTPALRLYQKLGYEFKGEVEAGQLVGFLDLERNHHARISDSIVEQ